jgi:thioredoxin-like negative regulator of GroEL
MATTALPKQRLRLVFFHSILSGHCRRVEGFLAQVLQRRHNHGTFRLLPVAEEERPDLLRQFRVKEVPTRLSKPRGCREIERFLAPWLN